MSIFGDNTPVYTDAKGNPLTATPRRGFLAALFGPFTPTYATAPEPEPDPAPDDPPAS